MGSAAETRLQVTQQDVDPAKLGKIFGVTPNGYHSSVATACGNNQAEEVETIRKNKAATRQVLSCTVSKRL